MDRELQHSLANLLASVAEEWFRYYGDTQTQLSEMRAVVGAVFLERTGDAWVCPGCGWPWPGDEA